MSENKLQQKRDRLVNGPSNEAMFVTWNDTKGSKEAALANASKGYGAIVGKEYSQGSNSFMNVVPNLSVRDGFNKRDWEYFRPEESTAKNMRGIMGAAMMAYEQIGIVQRIINLMGEFTCQGVRLVHQNPGVEQLHQEWAKKIGLAQIAERFSNYLYRTCNVIVQRETALLKETDIENLRHGIASVNREDVVERIDPPPKVRKGEIPWGYTFLNPLALDILGGDDLSQFAGVALFGLPIPEKVYNKIRSPKTQEERYIVSQLPDHIIKAARNGIKIVPLDPAKVQSFYYKKDDWQLWAKPLLYSVMDDLILYNKLRLADLSALDGAISHIRLWRLGNIENKIAPTAAGIARLAEILANNTAVGAIDLIWGPDLELQETSTDVYKFLGPEKYTQCIQNIYDGLGVPYSLRGSGGKGGMASFLSLKVLMEQLKFGRRILNSFLEPELVLFQRALGLRFPAQIQYDYMVLDDPNTFLRLLIELVDRDLLSAETVQEAFGTVPEIEQMRIRGEHKKRESGKMKNKAGPYHNSSVEDEFLKLFIQAGVVTPSQVGLELGEKAPGEKTKMEMDIKAQKDITAMKPAPVLPGAKPKGKSGQGRPAGKKDSGQRKKRAVKPTKAAAYFATRAWAKEIQNTIAEVVNPLYTESCGKKNVRSLTEEEYKNLEDFRFAVLCNLTPHSSFTIETLQKMMDKPLPIPEIINNILSATLSKFSEKFNRVPTMDETRLFQAEVYSLYSESEFLPEEEEDTTNLNSIIMKD